MLLRRGFYANRDPSTIYTTVADVENFFRDIAATSVSGGTQAASERLSAVASAHRIYTNSLAVLPWMIRRKVGDSREEPSHPLERVLKQRANEYMSPFTAFKVMASQAFWWGTGHMLIRRERGRIVELLPLPTVGSQRYRDQNTGAVWYSFSALSDQPGAEYITRKFQASELMIFQFESYDGYRGRGVMDLARDTIDTDAAAQAYNKKFYRNGSRVSGLVKVNGSLDRDTRDIVRADFERMAQGLDNAFRTAVLDNGMDYTPLGISQKDSQYLESRGFAVEEISRFTGIPTYMMQSGKQSYQSNEQQQLDFVINTLTPPVTQLEQEATYKLLSGAELDDGYYLKRNMAALLRGDNKSRSEYYQTMIGMAMLSPDEARALEDRSPLPNDEGKKYWMSRNYDVVGNVINNSGAGGGE